MAILFGPVDGFVLSFKSLKNMVGMVFDDVIKSMALPSGRPEKTATSASNPRLTGYRVVFHYGLLWPDLTPPALPRWSELLG
jgi:hypothetical protein